MSSCSTFVIKNVPNRINKASLPTGKYTEHMGQRLGLEIG